MQKVEAWLKAFRLRTLPLSFSSVILGSLLAWFKDSFESEVMIWALVTTLFLQILSNLANDYGDWKNGVDNAQRIGPSRTMQSGEINPEAMKKGIIIMVLLSLVSGIWLLVKATNDLENKYKLLLLAVGILAIGAAIKYTMGKKPYGYQGLGDIAVFLFFGLTGVLGTFFLHTHQLSWQEVLPAASIGFLATGVLNLNNLRDRESDRESGKKSLVVIIGVNAAKVYHLMLLSFAMVTAIFYTLLNYQSPYQFLYLIIFPLFIQNISIVWKNSRPSELDGELKKLAISTLLFSITFGLGLIY